MKITYKINFKSKFGDERPSDESINEEEIVTTNLGDVPQVGDFVCFNNNIYLVKSRVLEYNYKKTFWSVLVHVNLESQPAYLYDKLVKH